MPASIPIPYYAKLDDLLAERDGFSFHVLRDSFAEAREKHGFWYALRHIKELPHTDYRMSVLVLDEDDARQHRGLTYPHELGQQLLPLADVVEKYGSNIPSDLIGRDIWEARYHEPSTKDTLGGLLSGAILYQYPEKWLVVEKGEPRVRAYTIPFPS